VTITKILQTQFIGYLPELFQHILVQAVTGSGAFHIALSQCGMQRELSINKILYLVEGKDVNAFCMSGGIGIDT